MKKKYFLIFLLIPFIFAASIQDMHKAVIARKNVAAGGYDCTGYLICQNLETPTTGYDNSESWTPATTGTGAVDPVYTPALEGTQSVELNSGDGTARITSPTFAAQSVLYGFFELVHDEVASANNTNFYKIQATGSTKATIILRQSNFQCVAVGGTTQSDSVTLTDAVKYYVWWDYTKSTGANDGTINVYVSATTTKPSATCTSNDGTSTDDVNMFFVQAGGTQVIAADRFYIDDANITGVP